MKTSGQSTFLLEEKRTTIWYLWLFYLIFFSYEIFYYYLSKRIYFFDYTSINILNYILYTTLIILLPFSIYLIKKDKPSSIKYIYFWTYSILSAIHAIILYSWTDEQYGSGNIIEMVIVLFSPIFINKKYFYIITIGTITKLLVIGVALLEPIVLLPIVLIITLAVIAYIILHRFLGYVEVLKHSYNQKLVGIVKSVITTLELKDPYTRGHSERVAEYALSLAKATGAFNEEELQYFYYACLLHDIGKINIPDAILSKPGKLTDEEFEHIKSHPVVGAKAVEGVQGIENYIDVILHHHERWDGKGYPEGLTGENIPFAARITAIADAFDAMTSTRSYRSAMPLEEAYRRVIENQGTQFDPNLVELFKQVYSNWTEDKCDSLKSN